MLIAGIFSFLAKGFFWAGALFGAFVTCIVMSLAARKGDKGQANVQNILVVIILVVILLILLRAFNVI